MDSVNLNDRLTYPATLRNRVSISRALGKYIPQKGVLLEIASGSGEHGVFFQRCFPSIIWQTSDPEAFIEKVLFHGFLIRAFSQKCPHH